MFSCSTEPLEIRAYKVELTINVIYIIVALLAY